MSTAFYISGNGESMQIGGTRHRRWIPRAREESRGTFEPLDFVAAKDFRVKFEREEVYLRDIAEEHEGRPDWEYWYEQLREMRDALEFFEWLAFAEANNLTVTWS